MTAIFSGSPTVVAGGAANNNAWLGSNSTDTASCGAGRQLLSGYLEWTTLAGGEELATVFVQLDPAAGTVTVSGMHDEISETYRAVAVCLD